jgi:Type I phosphodiesterase / nucleotide pyrophosphatase
MVLGHWDVRQRGKDLAIDAPFIGSGLQHVYQQGRLGPTLMQGGDGTAEKAFIDSLRQMAAHYSTLWLHHFRHPDHDDIYGYQPALDLALHELIGFVVPDCGHASPMREQVVWPLLLDLLADFDRVFGATLAIMKPEDRILLTSDHGMMPVDTLIRPNPILEEMGLLQRTPTGGIDAGRSLAWLHPAENGVLCIDASAHTARQKSPEATLSDL